MRFGVTTLGCRRLLYQVHRRPWGISFEYGFLVFGFWFFIETDRPTDRLNVFFYFVFYILFFIDMTIYRVLYIYFIIVLFFLIHRILYIQFIYVQYRIYNLNYKKMKKRAFFILLYGVHVQK